MVVPGQIWEPRIPEGAYLWEGCRQIPFFPGDKILILSSREGTSWRAVAQVSFWGRSYEIFVDDLQYAWILISP